MNNNTTLEKINFLQLISNYRVEIPIIQRDYAQGREGKEELRKNFLGALYEVVNDKIIELDFVYGSVKKDINGNKTLQPLDGQQRLTTLFLLHWFVATKENKLDDELKKLLTKFTYETRTSSRDFCNDLINNGIDFNNLLTTDYHDKEKIKPKNNELSKTIIDNSWFFLSWKRDPTIKSMLTMLDAIHQTFKQKKCVWEKLNNISFHYIELENFGLSDDLYIKMNARGKPLTEFENFKAKFEQYINQNGWENNVNLIERFAQKIDNKWADLFWKYRNKIENIFDEQFLNFFRTMAVINYTLNANINDKNFRINIDLLRGSKAISFNQYLELGCFDEDYFKTIKSTLNKLSGEGGLNTFLFDATYVNEETIFNNTIKNSFSYPDLVIAFAYYQYLASEENIEIEKLKSWLRIVRNLVEGSRPYLFNNANEFANALHSIKELLEYRNSIVEYFSETQSESLSGFIREQLIEEKQKAILILQNDDWKDAIIEIENHKYFNGQIGFLLDWCKTAEEFNLDIFMEYAEKSKAIFGENGLNNFKNFLFERALLATGDYLLSKGQNLSFLLLNNDRDISWKRLLRSNSPQRETLKKLFFNTISITNTENNLQTIVNNFSDTNDWRYYFIKQFEIIAACGEQKLIRKNSDSNILLLGSTTTSGYHKEYYSYSLFIELKQDTGLNDNSYKEQKSVNYPKYFELKGKQIEFDCSDEKKYIWTQNNDWKNKQEFESRENAILTLKQT